MKNIFCEHGMRKYAVIVLCVLLVQLFTYFVPNNVLGTVTQESPDLDKATVFKFYDAWKADPKSIEASHPLVDGSGSDLTNNIYVSQAGSTVAKKHFWPKQMNGEQKWISANVSLPAEQNYAVYVNLPFANKDGDAAGTIILTDQTDQEQKISFDFSAGITNSATSNPGWYKIGEFQLGTTVPIRFETTTNAKQIRVDTVAFQPASAVVPTSLPSAEASAAPEETRYTYEEDFNIRPLGAFTPSGATDWKITDPLVKGEIKQKTEGNNYLSLHNQASAPKPVNTSVMSALNSGNKLYGEEVMLGFRFNIKEQNGSSMFIIRTDSGAALGHFDISVPAGQTGKIRVDYKYSPSSITEYTKILLDQGTWYQMLIKVNSYTGLLDFYVLNEDGSLVTDSDGNYACRKDVPVRYDIQTTNNIADVGYIQFNNLQPGEIVYLDDVFISNEGTYTVPSIPSPTPTPVTKIYDNNDPTGDTIVTYHMPDGIDEAEAVQTSTTGLVSENAYHSYTDIHNSYIMYQLKNPGTGLYEVYFKTPLVHSNNTNEMYVELTDSTGKVHRQIVDIRSVTEGMGTSAMGYTSGDWVKIGTTFTFFNAVMPSVKIGLGPGDTQIGTDPVTGEPVYQNSGNYRADGIKVIKAGDIEPVLLAADLTLNGTMQPGQTLMGTYTYTNTHGGNNDVAEGESEIRWLTKKTEADTYTVKKQGTKSQSDILNYTLEENDLYVRFEVIPKDINGKTGPMTATEIAAGLPQAKGVSITGRLRPYAELKARYTYSHPNALAEKDSSYTWYAKTAENEAYKQVASGSDTYIVQPGERYIKFEVIPKCDTNFTAAVAGTPISAEFDTVYTSDFPPVISDLSITGDASAHATLTASYKYSDLNLDEEQNSSYQWLATDDPSAPDNQWRALQSGTCTANNPPSYQIPSGFPAGEYIKLVITPKCDSNVTANGTPVTSNRIGPISKTVLGPAAKDIQLSGQTVRAKGIEGLAIDGKAELTYTYVNHTGMTEDTQNTKIQWYISGNATTGFTAIENAQSAEFTPAQEHKGKYIKAGITPCASDGTQGEESFSPAYQVKYHLSFYDEFDYTAKDGYDSAMREKWNPDSTQRDILGLKQARIPENVETKDGRLYIYNRKEHLDKYEFEHTWTTGNLVSKEIYGPYGYYESAYQYAYATGLNNSFWAMTVGPKYSDPERPAWVELDFNEGHFPRELKTNLHRQDENNQTIQGSVGHYPIGTHDFQNINSPTLADDLHVYGGYLKKNDPNYGWQEGPNKNTYRIYFDYMQQRSGPSVPAAEVSEVKIYISSAFHPGGFCGPLYEPDDPTLDNNRLTAHNTHMEVDYVRFFEELDVSAETLEGMIENANSMLTEIRAGSQLFECPSQYLTQLKTAADTAEGIAGQEGATTAQIKEQIDALGSAISYVERNIVYEGEVEQGATYDFTGITKPVKMMIPTAVTQITFVYPQETSSDIEIEYADTVQIIPKGTRLNGTFQIPSKTNFDIDGKMVRYSSQSFGLTAAEGLIQVRLPQPAGYQVGAYENGTIREITNKINKNTLGAAYAALGTFPEALYTENAIAHLWTASPGSYVVYTDQAETPSPTPTDGSTGSNSGTNTGSAGGTIVIPGTNDKNKDTFTDISGHWAQAQITALNEKGIIKGITETRFAPEETINRAQFAALIRRALNLNLNQVQNTLTDVHPNDWFAGEISAVVQSGIMTGDAEGTFRPYDPISRQEMAKVIIKAYQYKNNITELPITELIFTDHESVAPWAQQYVQNAVALGLMNGMGNGTFSPLAPSTRAQGAAVIFRLVKNNM